MLNLRLFSTDYWIRKILEKIQSTIHTYRYSPSHNTCMHLTIQYEHHDTNMSLSWLFQKYGLTVRGLPSLISARWLWDGSHNTYEFAASPGLAKNFFWLFQPSFASLKSEKRVRSAATTTQSRVEHSPRHFTTVSSNTSSRSLFKVGSTLLSFKLLAVIFYSRINIVQPLLKYT